MIRYPALLNADLSEAARLEPLSGSLTLNMTGASQASLSLPVTAPVRIHDWLSVWTGRGLAGIFRVSNAVKDLSHDRLDVTLLHGIDILNDSVWSAQTEFTGTKAEFITALLNQQTSLINGVKPWTLGTCADTSQYKRTINYDRLSNLLEELVEDGGDYYFTYDQTSFPWTLNYVAKAAGITSEFRITRNVRSASVTFNDADLCTRLHLSINVAAVDTDVNISTTNTIIKTYDNAAAQSAWGIVVKTADIDTSDNITADPPVTAEADAWAADFMAKRSEPAVQIQIDGDELRQLTGESWDEPDLGRLCRVALPDYGHTFEERVVALTYPDLYDDTDTPHITVSLANTLPRFSETLATVRNESEQTARRVRGIGRSAASSKDELYWSKRVKYQGAALDGTGIITLYESGIDMDASGGVTIYSLEEGLQALYSGIQVNAHNITLKVSNGQVATQLELECGNVHITGSSPENANLEVDGYITASALDTRLINVDSLFASTGYAGTIYASSFSGTSGNITSMTVGNLYMTTSGQASDQIVRKAVKIGGTTSSTLTVLGTGSAAALEVPDAITALQILPPEQGSNTYTLQGKTFSSPSQWADIGTFSRATSLSGAWSGSTFTVTATPQGDTESTTIAASGDGWDYDTNLSRYYNTVRVKNDGGNVTRASVDILLPTITLSAGSFNAQHKATVHAYGPSYEGSTYSVATALEVNASGVYTEGYTDGKDENEGISALGLSSAYDTQPSADEYKGELTANKYYKVTAVPVSGTGKSFSFKTPAGGSDSSLVTYITNCQGSDASSYVQYSGASSVNSNVVKDADGVKGYVWMKGPNGWERTRYIPISHPQTTAGISYISHDRGTYSGYLRVTVHLTGGSTETYTSQPM